MRSSPPPRFSLSVTREEDRFACAAEGVHIGRWAGLTDRARQELAIAIAELVSNAVRHGGGGTIDIRAINGPDPAGGTRWGVEVVVRDAGPGLDAEAAMARMALEDAAPKGDPRLPGQGLGLGLGAVHRLMSSVVIRSAPGQGTEVTAVRWS